ncbi:MAG TPA: alpha/beta hydrolase family protein [Chloroflexota bacterium]|nr:alpha/beta hydrolase family protein [Chloroflexota bacterium]
MALCELRYFSAALEKMTAATLILPEGRSGPFPTFYLLHGLSDDHTAWTRNTSLERYAAAYPFLIVMPDGGRGYYSDAPGGDAYETAIVRDLVTYVDQTFQTDPRPEARAIGGLSMGGYGALKLGMGYPDLFGSVTSHSCSRAVLWTHESNTDEEKFLRAFGPMPRGGSSDLFALAERIDQAGLPALSLDCGTEDELLEVNRHFHAHLEALHIPHLYREYPGGHAWDYWDRRIQEALAFHARALHLASERSSYVP